MFTEEQARESVQFLSETDVSAARLKTDAERMEFKAKVMREKIFLMDEGSVADRNARATIHPSYITAMEDYFNAVQAADEIRNKRITRTVEFDGWRTASSNARKA